MKYTILFLLFLFTIIGCGSDGDTQTIGIVSVTDDTRVLGASEPIIVVFNRSFDGVYSFEGDLSSQVSATLGTTNVENDTLTLNPITTWDSGTGLNLIIKVNASVGTAREITLEDFEVI